jgi:hypothetical protein
MPMPRNDDDDVWKDINPVPRTMARPPAETGRPRADMNLDTIERAASIGCTTNEIAALLDISPSTLFLRMNQDAEIHDAIERGRDKGRATLRRNQWQKAMAGSDTMLIWLGKQMLGQRDQTAITGADGGAVVTQVIYSWDDGSNNVMIDQTVPAIGRD